MNVKDSRAIAIAVESSHNAKTGKVSATYVTQESCPPTCGYRNDICYAEKGMVAFTTRRLNAAALEVDNTPESIAQSEADAIGNLTGKLPLRVHVVGDCQTDSAARIVSSAMLEHSAKHNQPAWTYTHAWRDVDSASWQTASVLASCESVAEIPEAKARGYATAVVVDSFSSEDYLRTPGLIACPEQATKKVTCATCQLCAKPDVLKRRGLTVAFAKH